MINWFFSLNKRAHLPLFNYVRMSACGIFVCKKNYLLKRVSHVISTYCHRGVSTLQLKTPWSNDWHNFFSWLYIVLVFAFTLCVFAFLFAIIVRSFASNNKPNWVKCIYRESGSITFSIEEINHEQISIKRLSASIWCNTHRISSHTHTCSKISAYRLNMSLELSNSSYSRVVVWLCLRVSFFGWDDWNSASHQTNRQLYSGNIFKIFVFFRSETIAQ